MYEGIRERESAKGASERKRKKVKTERSKERE